MSEVTVGSLAKMRWNYPVEKLLEQLAEAGMAFSGPDQVVTSTEKMKLLGFLRRTHGKAEKPAEACRCAEEDHAQPPQDGRAHRRRGRQGQDHGQRRSPPEAHLRQARRGRAHRNHERDEVLRKLEESKSRNADEQARLSEQDRARRRAAQRRKAAQEDARSAKEDAEEPHRCQARIGRQAGGRCRR